MGGVFLPLGPPERQVGRIPLQSIPPLVQWSQKEGEPMKITLNQDPSFQETEVVINCPQADEEILRLVGSTSGSWWDCWRGRATCWM